MRISDWSSDVGSSDLFGTRADPAYLSRQYIKNLGQFVETAAAQETAEAGDTIIVGACDRVITRAGLVDRAGSHSAELVDDERLATESDPLLAEDRRSAGIETDQNRDHC